MNRRKIGLLFSARSGSTRLSGKLTRPLDGEETAYSIYLSKLAALSASGYFDSASIAVYPGDGSLYIPAVCSGARVLNRTKESIEKGARLNHIFGCVSELDCEYVMWVNACHPLLKARTIVAAARQFDGDENIKSMTSVVSVQGMFWGSNGVPIHDHENTRFRTDGSSKIRIACHAFHIWDRKKMLEEGVPWSQSGYRDPLLFEIVDKKEALDIDSKLDFEIVSHVYASESDDDKAALYEVP